MNELTGMRILIVEDDEECAVSLAELLEAYDCVPAVSHSLAAAREAWSVGRFDLALVDLTLGAENGLDLAIEWLATDEGRGRVVLLSGREPTAAELSRFPDGAAPFLLKPVDIDRLIELSEAVGLRSS
jgi:DNA-binding response OmpR family regulator